MARKPKQDLDQNTISDTSKNADHFKSNDAVSTNTDQSLVKHDQEKSIPAESTAKFADAEYRSRCGGALRLAREKQGLATRDVANQLRLSIKQIEAIETDNFAALPEPTIVKGFIRNYAKLLKIPVEPLLDAYLVIVPNKTHHSLTIQPASAMHLSSSTKPTSSNRYFLILLAVLFAVGLWFFYQGYIQKPSPVLPTTELKESLPEAALPMAERNNSSELDLPPASEPNTADASVASPSTSVPLGNENTNTQTETAAVETPVTTSPPAENVNSEKAPANSQTYKLEFNASQETWVSVVDANEKEVYNKILFSGNREVIEAKPPLNIVVGNSHGATLTVNNQAVDLAPHTRVNVARLRID